MNKKLSKKTVIELACKTGGEKQASSFRTEKKHEHGKHPNSIKNLKPYETGQSGNPGGRSDAGIYSGFHFILTPSVRCASSANPRL